MPASSSIPSTLPAITGASPRDAGGQPAMCAYGGRRGGENAGCECDECCFGVPLLPDTWEEEHTVDSEPWDVL